jgi:Protein of unknown function (DUF3987)
MNIPEEVIQRANKASLNGDVQHNRFPPTSAASPGGKKKPVPKPKPEAEVEGNKVNDLISSRDRGLGGEAYYGFIGDFLRLVSPLTEATDVCVLAHLIPAIGTVIGPKLHYWGGDEQPVRFNTAVVGPTSDGRKGTGMVPVKQLMQHAAPDFWKGQPAKGLSSGEGLIAKVADKVTRDQDGNEIIEPVEKRCYVVEPEFSKVLANIRRENNILSQIMREAYDSGNLSTLTVNPREAFGAHICITGHITAEELSLRLSEIEMANGFGNRFLWFYVKSDKLLPHAEPIPEKKINEFAERLKGIFTFADELMSKNSLRVRESTRVVMDDDARSIWDVEYPTLRKSRPGFVGALTARGPSQVARLALLYALLDKSDTIKRPHLDAAFAVWNASVASVEMLFGKKKGNSIEDKLYDLLGKGPMETREFYKHMASKAEDVRAALGKLEANGLVKQTKRTSKGPGRPAIVWEQCGNEPAAETN